MLADPSQGGLASRPGSPGPSVSGPEGKQFFHLPQLQAVPASSLKAPNSLLKQPQSHCLEKANVTGGKQKNITPMSKETMSRGTELYPAQIFQKDEDFHGSVF